MSSSQPVVIIGAGMAGLIAADVLRQKNYSVVVLEKSNALGGRLATRRLQSAVLDHGAQYFTARDAGFLERVQRWQAEGVVDVWFEKESENSRHPAYVGHTGMTGIAKHLATGLDVRKQAKVTHFEMAEAGWEIFLENGDSLNASGLILTAPVPQTLAILEASRLNIPEDAHSFLKQVDYDPCVALLLCLDKPVNLPHPAGFWQPETGSLIGWVADNHQKGISPKGYGLTIQLAPASSAVFFEQSDAACFDCMSQAVRPYLGDAQILEWQVKRWRYALVKNAGTQYYQWLQADPPLILAGDAFGGPRVEGAALSGLQAAEQLVSHLLASSVTSRP